MEYNRVGNSGLKRPAISLGMWHNFGEQDAPGNQLAMLKASFDRGITHFDLTDNYGGGFAEINVGYSPKAAGNPSRRWRCAETCSSAPSLQYSSVPAVLNKLQRTSSHWKTPHSARTSLRTLNLLSTPKDNS